MQKERVIVCREIAQEAESVVIAEFVVAFDVLHTQYGKRPPYSELAKAGIGWVRYMEAAAAVRKSGPDGLVRCSGTCARRGSWCS